MTMIRVDNVTEPPPLWEIEFRVADLTARQTGIEREQVKPGSRLLEDLHIDSLDLVELILAVEEEFAVTIPDDVGKDVFVNESPTIAALAQIVRDRWGTGAPTRKQWLESSKPSDQRNAAPFTQLGGVLDDVGHRKEPLFQKMADANGTSAIPASH